MADGAPETPCGACRGTGEVVSSKGGTSHRVTCPWCDGSGRRQGPEHDAQARHRTTDEPPPAA